MADNIFFEIQGEGLKYKDKVEPDTIRVVSAQTKINELIKATAISRNIAIGPSTSSTYSILDFTDVAGLLSVGPIGSNRNNAVSDFLIDFTPKPDFANGIGQELKFLNAISDDQVNDLINQLKISKFKGSRSFVEEAARVFLKEVSLSLGSFPQIQLANQLKSKVSSDSATIQNLEADIKINQEKIANINQQPISQDSKNNKIAQLNADLKSKYSSMLTSNDPISDLAKAKRDLEITKSFANLSGSLNDKVFSNFTKFSERFSLVISTLYDALNPSEDKETSRKKQSDVIKTSQAEEERAGLGVDRLKQQQERLIAEAEADDQIIQISSTGANKFSHAPMEQALSILDILRTEEDISSFETKTNVSQTETASTATGDNASVCNELLKKFNQTDLQNMIKALQDQKSINATVIAKNLVDINRMQKSGGFQFMSAFSGITGIDFSNVNFDAFNIDFAQIKSNLVNGISSVKNLVIDDLGSQFGQLVNQTTGIIDSTKSQLIGLTKSNMNSVNFNKVFSGIDADTIRKCPTLSQIKNTMQNPSGVATSTINKAKNEAMNTTKAVSEKVDLTQSLVEQNQSLDNQINQLTTLINAGGLGQ